MSVVHTLTGAQAPKRSDDELWMQVRIEQSLDKVLVTTADTQVLDPPETDPQNPIPNRIITFESEHEVAFFRLVFIDVDGDTSPPTAWVQDDGSSASLGWIPTPEEVAALVRARIKTMGGGERPTFEETTRPTRNQVLELIEQAADDVTAQVGTVPPVLEEAAKSVVNLGTAMLIELSFFPEQIQSNRSPYDGYEKMYDRKMKALVEAAQEIKQTGDIVPGTEDELQSNKPSYYFDDNLKNGLVYW